MSAFLSASFNALYALYPCIPASIKGVAKTDPLDNVRIPVCVKGPLKNLLILPALSANKSKPNFLLAARLERAVGRVMSKALVSVS